MAHHGKRVLKARETVERTKLYALQDAVNDRVYRRVRNCLVSALGQTGAPLMEQPQWRRK